MKRLRRLLSLALPALLAGPARPARADEATALAASVQDVPAENGQPGLLRVVSAMPSHAGRVALIGRLGFYSTGDFVDTGQKGTLLDAKLAFDYSFFSWLDAGLGMHLATGSTPAQDPVTQTYGTDVFPRVRAAWRLGDFAVAGLVGARLIGGIDEIAFDFHATGADLWALASYAPAALGEERPLRVHLNAGLVLDRSRLLPTGERSRLYRFESSIAETNWLEYGLGAEYQQRLATPFLELTADQPLGVGARPWQGPGRLELGVRSSPLSGLILEGSLELGRRGAFRDQLPDPPGWLARLGLGYTFAPFTRVEVRKEVEQVKLLEGRVLDAGTGQPIAGAQVAFANGAAPTVVSNDAGRFQAFGLPSGEVEVKASHPDYQPASKTITWPRPEGAGPLELSLAPRPRQGRIEGKVTDLDGNPVAATLELSGPGGALPPAQAPQGAFDQALPEGEYQLTVRAPGHLASGLRFKLGDREKVLVSLVLRPIPAEKAATLEAGRISIHQRINFASAKADLLPDARPILDEVVDILLSHPEIKHLRVEGHTDDLGGDMVNLNLSIARAASVKRYLVEHGVSPERLSSAGYGLTKPLVKGTDPAARAANRRVEFVIVDDNDEPVDAGGK